MTRRGMWLCERWMAVKREVDKRGERWTGGERGGHEGREVDMRGERLTGGERGGKEGREVDRRGER